MRPALTLSLVVLVAASAAALPAPAACVPTCEVASPVAVYQFLPPVQVVHAGATVTWTSPELHTATSAHDACFNVVYGGASSGNATFRIEGGALFAKVRDIERACTAAQALPDGSFALDYKCFYHPTMVGRLVVRPA